jgi:hypothetical protein
MAREAPGESKQAYIVALVFFVLISIVLGVTTWLGYSDRKRLEDDKKQATDKEASIKKQRDSLDAQLAALKLATGIGHKEDSDTLAGSPNKAEGDTLIKTQLANLLRWDENQGKPDRSLSEQLVTAREQARQGQTGMQNSETKAKEEAKNAEELLAQNRAKQAKLEQDIKRLNDQVKEVQDSKTKAFQEQAELVAAQRTRIEKGSKDFQDQKDEYEKLLKQLRKDNADLRKNYDRLAKKTVVEPDYVAYEKPLGKIMTTDPRGQFAYINLGTADHVKPQLTFSVFSSMDTYRAGRDPKASIEVVRATGPHDAQVRITDVRDRGRDPIVRGDLIYNPAWNPDLKQHIAIAGVIDITGDGSDSTPEVVRNLRKQNIVVDAYLDLHDATVKGEITRQTGYLVMGEKPDINATVGLEQAASANDLKKDINLRMGEMEETAHLKGVAVLPARRFLLLIGYPMPRTVAAPDYVMPGVKEVPQARRPKPAAGGDAAKPAAKPKPDDNGKE